MIQDFFAANPQFAQRFPGGIVEFAHIAAQMPEDALEDLMVAVVNGAAEGAPGGEGRMPGQMPGEDFFHDDLEPPVGFHEEEPQRDNEAEEAENPDEDEDEDEEDVEDVAVSSPCTKINNACMTHDLDKPLPIRLLRNVMNRFWGAPADEQSSDDEQLRDEAGVD